MTDEHIVGGNRRPIQRAQIKAGGWTKARRRAFLDALARTCNVRMATEAAGMRGKSPYDLRRRDSAFAGLWQEALAIGYERLEQGLLEFALSGVNAIDIDPDRAVDPEDEHPTAGHRIPGSGVAPIAKMTALQAQIALAMLNRRRDGGGGAPARGVRAARRLTDAEVEAELKRRLDIMARQMRDGQA